MRKKKNEQNDKKLIIKSLLIGLSISFPIGLILLVDKPVYEKSISGQVISTAVIPPGRFSTLNHSSSTIANIRLNDGTTIQLSASNLNQGDSINVKKYRRQITGLVSYKKDY